jgi:hypothetical protein
MKDEEVISRYFEIEELAQKLFEVWNDSYVKWNQCESSLVWEFLTGDEQTHYRAQARYVLENFVPLKADS